MSPGHQLPYWQWRITLCFCLLWGRISTASAIVRKMIDNANLFPSPKNKFTTSSSPQGLVFAQQCPHHGIDGLMQERRNSVAYVLELRLSCTNPSISWYPMPWDAKLWTWAMAWWKMTPEYLVSAVRVVSVMSVIIMKYLSMTFQKLKLVVCSAFFSM